MEEKEFKPRITKFVLHKHDALKAGRHYDLRIKYFYKNKLASWALPKAKIPKQVSKSVLAIRTNDHDTKWLKFSGKIPEGNYGAGKIKIVQSGQLQILKWGPKQIIFIASGSPLNGKYSMIKFNNRRNNNESWLLIKGKD